VQLNLVALWLLIVYVLPVARQQKVVDRLLSKPSDFEWRELKTVMESFGYELKQSRGSSRKFIHRETKAVLMIHEPHPSKVLKSYQVSAVIHFLRQEKHVK
jgi:predicted RNA binding protein YcfA (HicA-like mRNA interferase family)